LQGNSYEFPVLSSIKGQFRYTFDLTGVYGSPSLKLPTLPALRTIAKGVCIQANFNSNHSIYSSQLDLTPLSKVGIGGSCYIGPHLSYPACPCRTGCNDVSACADLSAAAKTTN